MTMPKNRRSRLSILVLFKQLAVDAVNWSQEELALTRSDAKSLFKRYLIALCFIFFGFALLIAAIFTLAQTLIGALAVYLHGHLIAGLIASLTMFVLTFAMLAAARYLFMHKARARGIVFQRFMSDATE